MGTCPPGESALCARAPGSVLKLKTFAVCPVPVIPFPPNFSSSMSLYSKVHMINCVCDLQLSIPQCSDTIRKGMLEVCATIGFREDCLESYMYSSLMRDLLSHGVIHAVVGYCALATFCTVHKV